MCGYTHVSYGGMIRCGYVHTSGSMKVKAVYWLFDDESESKSEKAVTSGSRS